MAIIARELWKPVVGYEGLYEVSDYGRIRSLSGYRGINMWGAPCFIQGKTLSPTKNRKGYLAVRIKNKTLLVHRLVGFAFFPFEDAHKLHINHIDCDKTNNCIENLEWCDNLYNTAHAVANGRYEANTGENNIRSILTEEKVIEIRRLLKTKEKTPKEISEIFGVKRTAIYHVKHRLTWKHI